MRAAALYSAAGSLLLTGLSVTPGDGTPGAADAAELRGTVVAAARARSAGLDFGACPDESPAGMRCATVRVPLDYARPGGRQIELTVSRMAATQRDPANSKRKVPRQGALVYNPGGPGASSLNFPMIGVIPEWQRIASAYDLVGYAPRGVAPSAPLSCEKPEEFFKAPSLGPVHPTEAYKRERIARAKAYARGCAERSGSGLEFYNSLNNARDLDVLRAALGESRLTFMGASYGTYVGALYAGLFPGHVRRMVLDSAVDPDPAKVWYRENLDQSAAFEDRWADFRAWVARHDDVYGLGATPAAVQRSYDTASDRLQAHPADGRVGPGQLQNTFLMAGYYDDYWPSRAAALAAYLKGDAEPLVRLGAPNPETAAEAENGSAVYTAVECNDAPWPADFRVWDRDNTRLARTAPFETWDNAWTNLPCAYWSARRQVPLDVRTGRGETPPVLILAAERDAGHPVRRGAGAEPAAGRVHAGHRAGRGHARHRRRPQPVCQRPPGRLPARRPSAGPPRRLRPAPGAAPHRAGRTRHPGPGRAGGQGRVGSVVWILPGSRGPA